MKLIVIVVAIIAVFCLALAPADLADIEEPPERIPHIGGSGTGGYRMQAQTCPSPSSIEYSNTILQWPLDDVGFNQYFNWGHPGVDLWAYLDQPIKSVGYGFVDTVEFAPYGYGWYVIIKHPDGWETLYGHMNDHPEVDEGDYVFPGKVIGHAGSTGRSTGVHLHFEILKNSCYLNPISVLGTN